MRGRELTRREFMTGGGGILRRLAGSIAGESGADAIPVSRVPERVPVTPEPGTAPLIAEVDLLVVGGALTGVAAAAAAARKRKKVLLVAAGTVLGDEITRWGRPWVRWRESGRTIAARWLGVREGATPEDGVVPLHMDSVKRSLEDGLLDSGAGLLYASRPVAVRSDRGGYVVTIGNKAGHLAVRAGRVLDASENGCLDWIIRGGDGAFMREPWAGVKRRLIARRTIEFSGVAPDRLPGYALPDRLGTDGHRAVVHPGARGSGHAIVGFRMAVETAAGASLADDLELEFVTREKALEVAAHLVRAIPAFRKAKIGFGSLRAMTSEPPDPVAALAEGEGVAEELFAPGANRIVHLRSTCRRAAGRRDPSGPAFRLRRDADFPRRRGFRPVPESLRDLPVLAAADVLVVGGGVSGAPAAFAAAERGASVALLEMNHALGGTGTVGAVNAYWYSLKRGYALRIIRAVEAAEKRLRHREDPVPCGDADRYTIPGGDKWSYEVKSQVLWRLCREAGADVFLDCLTTGTLMRGKSAGGVALATPYGPAAATGAVIVDATGDGDVAFHAGARCVYGNDRDAMTMWCSLGQYAEPGRTRGNFHGIADVGDPLDYTRAVLTGRRRGGPLHDHATYLAPRETRHVIGGIVLGLREQMMLERFPDTVCMCYSNHDPKGVSAGDLIRFGLVPPQLEAAIPYRAVVPRGIDGVLVAGKAFSATHDALAGPRMQMDLENLGGAVGTAAALCAAKGVAPRRLPAGALQRRLVMEGVLDRRWLKTGRRPPPLAEAARTARPGELDLWSRQRRGDRILAPLPVARLFYAPAREAVPVLREAHARASGGRRLLLARLLAWHGSRAGESDLTREVERLLDAAGESLPRRSGSMRFTGTAPDQGTLPETANLVNCLARARSPAVLPLCRELARRILREKRDYRDARLGVYHHVEGIAHVAERLADPAFAPLLARLLRLPELRQPVERSRVKVGEMPERQSYLALCLARALARCGRRRGLEVLAEFTRDNRGLLSRSARRELGGLLGRDLGLDYARWKAAIRRRPARFQPVPWTKRID